MSHDMSKAMLSGQRARKICVENYYFEVLLILEFSNNQICSPKLFYFFIVEGLKRWRRFWHRLFTSCPLFDFCCATYIYVLLMHTNTSLYQLPVVDCSGATHASYLRVCKTIFAGTFYMFAPTQVLNLRRGRRRRSSSRGTSSLSLIHI